MVFSDENEVRDALAPYHDDFVQLANNAWQKWVDVGLTGQLRYPGRSRACLVHDFFVQEAVRVWSDNDRVRVIEKDETAKFVFDDLVVGRFKKADDRGLGSNIPTQATLSFTEQQQELPGIPNVHKVEVLYTLNRLHTQIERLDVVARDRDIVLWSYQIEPGAQSSAEIIPLSVAPSDSTRGATVKVKQPNQVAHQKSDISE